MRKFFSKGFFIGFLVTLVLGLILYYASILTVRAEKAFSEITLAESIVTPILGGAAIAFLGGVIGNWLYTSWRLKKYSRTAGFLFGAGLFPILSFVAQLLTIKGFSTFLPGFSIFLHLPGIGLILLLVIFLFPDSGNYWLYWPATVITSWVSWSFVGWIIGFLWEKIRKTA